MNFSIVLKYLGYFLIVEGLFLLPSMFVSVIYSETNTIFSFLISIALCIIVGFLFQFFTKKAETTLRIKESFAIAGLGWIIISLFGALPFWISKEIPSYLDAWFETVSGFTTTGSSILTDVESLSKGLLFWRSFTHWLGGMGVLVFLLTLVKSKRGEGYSLHLLRAESPGPQVEKLLPKTRDSARITYLLYIGLSIINLLFLLAGKMPLLDAFCIMFGTAGTGGFGIKNSSLADYSTYLQTVTTIFMALFGVNFSIYFLLVSKQWKEALKDEELRLYIGIMLAAIALCALPLIINGSMGILNAIHHSAFTVSSIMTTTGYATVDFDQWTQFAKTVLLVIMIFGAMAGSTGGGIKTSRIIIVIKSIKAQIYKLLHPRSVKYVTMNGKPLDSIIINRTFLYLSIYAIILIFSVLLVSLDNFSMETTLSAVLSCLNNIGPGLDAVGPTSNFSVFSNFSKLILSFDMLLGRLELLPLIVLLIPSTWRN